MIAIDGQAHTGGSCGCRKSQTWCQVKHLGSCWHEIPSNKKGKKQFSHFNHRYQEPVDLADIAPLPDFKLIPREEEAEVCRFYTVHSCCK